MSILDRPEIQARIRAMSQSRGIPEELIRQQIMKESSGNPNAVGDNGQSIGLGQIYDPTWAMLQGRNPDLQDRRDPMQNIQAMDDLWKLNLESSGGDVYKALRAYNGSGPMAEKYAQSLYKYADPTYSSGGSTGMSAPQSGMPQQPQLQTAMTRPAQLGGSGENAAAYEQWMQDQIGAREQTPLQAGLEVFGQSMQHAPYMGNRGFGGGFAAALQAGAAKSGRDRAMDKKLEHDLLRFRADMESRDARATADAAERSRAANLDERKFAESTRQWNAEYASDQREGALEVGGTPEWMPPMYGGDPTKYFAQADKIGEGKRKALSSFEEGAKHFNTVKTLIAKNPDTSNWSAAETQVAIKSLEKLLDPTSIVRGSEADAYKAGASVLEKNKKKVSQWLEGGTELAETEINDVLRTLNRVYEASLPQARSVLEGFIKRGRQRGVISNQRNDAFTVHDWSDPLDLSSLKKGQLIRGTTPAPVPSVTPEEFDWSDTIEDDR